MLEYIIIGLIGLAIGWFLGHRNTQAREKELSEHMNRIEAVNKYKQYELNSSKEQLTADRLIFEREQSEYKILQEAGRQEFTRLFEQLKMMKNEFQNGFLKGRNWLATAFSEYIELMDTELECAFVTKLKPAMKSAEVVSDLRKKRKELSYKLKILEYQVSSYEEYFPFLVEYRDAILDEIIDFRKSEYYDIDDVDPSLSLGYLSRDEFNKLSNIEKYQLALDRYWKKKKSKIEIGCLYERYIGYMYESEGWSVKYQGILKGLEDFGRDLICTKNDRVLIIQCKCWSKDKIIREKHIMQLFGTYILFKITENKSNASPLFITTTDLSDEAKMVAKELKVEIKNIEIKRYPMIKCNINPNTNEKIYHLPFDQQYDRVIIENQRGEFYADTVSQAESNGFRRARKWYGPEENKPENYYIY